jgi:hypothetical protein
VRVHGVDDIVASMTLRVKGSEQPCSKENRGGALPPRLLVIAENA